MADFVYRGRTTLQLYRWMPRYNAQGQMLPSQIVGGVAVTFLDQNGNVLPRISINGEEATHCGGGVRDGSVPRGVIGTGYATAPTGPNQGPVMRPTWAPSDWELPD